MADRTFISSHVVSEHQRTRQLLTRSWVREQRRRSGPEDLPSLAAPVGMPTDDIDSDALSRSFLEASADCIKVLILDGALHSMNEKGRCLLEIDDFEQMKGQPWVEFWSHDQRPAVREALNAARTGGVGRFSGYRPTAKGLRSGGM